MTFRRGPIACRTVIAVLLFAGMTTPAAAAAAFLAAAPPTSLEVSSGALAPPTSPAAADGCTLIPLLNVWIDLSWVATTSTWADGYQIARSTTNGGPYTVVATVGGHGTTTYRDGGLALSSRYYYVIRATKFAWTSSPTAQVTDITKGVLCL